MWTERWVVKSLDKMKPEVKKGSVRQSLKGKIINSKRGKQQKREGN